jgi:NADH-quinone oxidoreductase subunit N
MFYVGVYTFATIGTFAVLLTLGGNSSSADRGAETIDDLNGLSKTHPIAALAMAVFMFSLTGIPPLAGFWGKFNLLIGAIQVDRLSNQTQGWFLILAIVGVLNAAIGATYYLRVIARMYFYENKVVLGESRNSGPILAGGICVMVQCWAAQKTRVKAFARLNH